MQLWAIGIGIILVAVGGFVDFIIEPNSKFVINLIQNSCSSTQECAHLLVFIPEKVVSLEKPTKR
ncbi:hypothetical protein GLYMA_12G021350v4 [Glycine max]|nr:hypothetical protein GLYMA_12G021350v4 [Glycine max]KAH1141200.1 hypothetical protein GYH30_032452 [Glycine max]